MIHAMLPSPSIDLTSLATAIKFWGRELGFSAVGITDTDLTQAKRRLDQWLANGWHGEMDYMERHAALRGAPSALHAGTLRVISARMDYWPECWDADSILSDGSKAYVSRYALGRDYHRVLRRRLQQLAQRIEREVGPHGYRVFADSAPVMEVELARKAGLGWRGKHTLMLSREGGSLFFLGEIFTDLPLPVDIPVSDHCGSCRKCLEICPTQAFVGPYQLDARRCISYLTIELKGSIPIELRPLIGNRVYGCDDCQLVCPWNKFAKTGSEPDFFVRNGLDDVMLVDLFSWDEGRFKRELTGSPISRIGYERWLRNIAVGLGNAPGQAIVMNALRARADHPSALVREHVQWAISRHGG
jgi:epoxyqueuosine reductase